MKNQPSADTLLAQLGHFLDAETGGLTPPFQPATTFARHPNYDLVSAGHIYARDDNSLYRLAEGILAQLEHGEDALLWPSGLAAVSALVSAVGLKKPIFVQKGIYYGITVWTRRHAERTGLTLVEFDATDVAELERLITAHAPSLIWVETPSNPMLETIDIAAIAKIAKPCGATLAVDSNGRHTDPLATTRSRRRHRHAFGDKIPERAFRCSGRRVDRAGCVKPAVASPETGPARRRQRAWRVRDLAVAARHAHTRRPGPRGQRQRRGNCGISCHALQCGDGALSRTGAASRP